MEATTTGGTPGPAGAERQAVGAAPARPSILIVCTGNVCRSPAAEFLLRQLLGPAAGSFLVHSAGTDAVPGVPIDPIIGGLLERRGIDATGFRSRELELGMLESADLILTASTRHGAVAGRMLPSTVRRTMTLKRLARYAPFIQRSSTAPTSDSDRIGWLLGEVPRARASAAGSRHPSDDVDDPNGRSRRQYAAAFGELERACAAIAPLFAGEAVPASTAPQWVRKEVHADAEQRDSRRRTPQGEPADGPRSFFDWAF